MALTMDGLAGFMRLGPQVYPARPGAAQVIERGPHGKRLAEDPVTKRLRAPKGSGFEYWVENLNVPASESWNPPQRVVGLMGLGALGAAGSATGRMDTALRDEGVPARGVCSLPQAKLSRIAERVIPKRSLLPSAVGEAARLAESVSPGDSPALRRAAALVCLVREAGGLLGWGPIRERMLAELNRVDRLLIVKKGERREDDAPMFAPGAVDPRTGEARLDPRTSTGDWYGKSVRDRYRELQRGRLCTSDQLATPFFGPLFCKSAGEPRFALKHPIMTAALVAGGAVLLYGFAQGFGAGLAGKR